MIYYFNKWPYCFSFEEPASSKIVNEWKFTQYISISSINIDTIWNSWPHNCSVWLPLYFTAFLPLVGAWPYRQPPLRGVALDAVALSRVKAATQFSWMANANFPVGSGLRLNIGCPETVLSESSFTRGVLSITSVPWGTQILSLQTGRKIPKVYYFHVSHKIHNSDLIMRYTANVLRDGGLDWLKGNLSSMWISIEQSVMVTGIV